MTQAPILFQKLLKSVQNFPSLLGRIKRCFLFCFLFFQQLLLTFKSEWFAKLSTPASKASALRLKGTTPQRIHDYIKSKQQYSNLMCPECDCRCRETLTLLRFAAALELRKKKKKKEAEQQITSFTRLSHLFISAFGFNVIKLGG